MRDLKKLLLVYNPASGDGSFHEDLDDCVEVFQRHGYLVSLFRTSVKCDTMSQTQALLQCGDRHCPDVVVVAGGDGTLNRVVNALMRSGCDTPLGVISAGTANDLARFIGVPSSARASCEAISAQNVTRIDLGQVNGGDYFINVCATGMLTTISQFVDQDAKNRFGKLAYYIKGIEQIPSFVPLRLKITTSREVLEEELYFFYILNSGGAGGFDKLSPTARLDDGLFDFVGFRAFPIFELPALFIKVLAGDYLDDRRILFLRDSYFRVEYVQQPDNALLMKTDIDGEVGPQLPIEVKNVPRALQIFQV